MGGIREGSPRNFATLRLKWTIGYALSSVLYRIIIVQSLRIDEFRNTHIVPFSSLEHRLPPPTTNSYTLSKTTFQSSAQMRVFVVQKFVHSRRWFLLAQTDDYAPSWTRKGRTHQVARNNLSNENLYGGGGLQHRLWRMYCSAAAPLGHTIHAS